MKTKRKPKKKQAGSAIPLILDLLRKHFQTKQLHELVAASRVFPITARADLQSTLDDVLQRNLVTLATHGVFSQYGSHDTTTFATLASSTSDPPVVAPLQYEEVDIGELTPRRVLVRALWLCKAGDQRVAVLLSPVKSYRSDSGLHIEIAQLGSGADTTLPSRLLKEIEDGLANAQSYRGKVLSLEQLDSYSGKLGSVKVHKLRTVTREEVILPEKTLGLLERNVTGFINHRHKLKGMNMSLKKGLLFHGPPGTGKTHTIHYLASQLPNHTTLLITAEQVGLLAEYMQLARFLQPAIVVLEDVDLIARSRGQMRSACEESTLNKLLNEMDGLREDAELIFILTTNRPEDLESALASRPGRVDQAIEFPLPDEEGRRKLIRLYAGKLRINQKLLGELVKRTKGTSAAFIKELMRRSAQYLIQDDGEASLQQQHVNQALDEMLFAGGTLNVKLLGGAVE